MEVFAVQNYGYLITINKLSSDNSACLGKTTEAAEREHQCRCQIVAAYY